MPARRLHLSKLRLLSSEPRQLPNPLALALIACLTAAAAALRFYHLDHHSLWLDEGFTFSLTELPLARLATTFLDSNPPAFFVLTWFTARMVEGEIGIRLVSVIAGVASVPALFFLSRKYLGAVGALVAAGFLTLSDVHVAFSQTGRPQALQVLLFIVVVLSLIRLLSGHDKPPGKLDPQRSWAFAYALSAVLACYVHVSSLIFLFAINLAALPAAFLALRQSRIGTLLPWVGANLAIGLLVLPILLLSASGASDAINWLAQPSAGEALQRLILVATAGSAGNRRLILLALVLAGAAVALLRTRELFARALIPTLIGVPLLVWLAGFVTVPMYMERTILSALLGSALALGAAAAFIRPPALAGGAIAIAVALQALSLPGYYQTPPRLGDYRTLVEFTRNDPADAALLCAQGAYDTFHFYERSDQPVFVWWEGNGDARLVPVNREHWMQFRGLPVVEQLAMTPSHASNLFDPEGLAPASLEALRSTYDKLWVVHAGCREPALWERMTTYGWRLGDERAFGGIVLREARAN